MRSLERLFTIARGAGMDNFQKRVLKLRWARPPTHAPTHARAGAEARAPPRGSDKQCLRYKRNGGQPPSWGVGDLVFPDGMPRMRDMRKDFDAAGLVKVDGLGRSVDFHCLRKTFNMNLQASGTASLTTVMNLMRHSDPKLTAKTYIDPMLLQKAQAVQGLPSFMAMVLEKGTQKGTHSIVKTCQNESTRVHLAATGTEDKYPENIGECRLISASVPLCPQQANGSGGRIRT
jgi:hypothetical protein